MTRYGTAWHSALGLAAGLSILAVAPGAAPRQTLALLVATMGPSSLPGRLSGTTSAVHVPAEHGERPIDPRRLDTWPRSLLQAIGESSRQADRRSASAVRLSAAIELFQGDDDAAAATLADALRRAPYNAQLLNDAAVADLVRARDSGWTDGRALVSALERALAVSERHPESPEALFNIAAAYEALGLGTHARDAWRRTLIRETDPTWRRYVLDALRTSERAMASSDVLGADVQSLRESIERERLPDWAAGVLATAPRATVSLDDVRRLAARVAEQQDRFLLDVVEGLERADEARRRRCAEAFVAYAEGRSRYDVGDREAALGAYDRASELLAEHAGAFLHEVMLQRATVLYQMRRLDEAARVVASVRAIAIARGYRIVSARADWLDGLVLMQQGRIEEAMVRYASALTAYESLHEPENAASVANTAADTLRLAGDSQRGWRMLTRASRALPRVRSLQRQYLILFNLSLYAQEEGWLRAARGFQAAAGQTADLRGHVPTRLESRVRRAELSIRHGDLRSAAVDLESARVLLRELSTSNIGLYLRAWLERMAARLDAIARPAVGSAKLEDSVREFERIESAEVMPLFLEAGRAALAAGERERASTLLWKGLAAGEQRQALMRTPEFRLAYMATVADLHQELIGIEVDRDPRRALAVAEAARTGLISAPPSAVSASPWPSVPADTAVLYYVTMRERIVVWALVGGRVEVRILAYRQDDLEADVDTYRRLVRTDREGLASHSMARLLYDRLLAPVLASAPDARRLLIAPDGPLGDLSFATLVDPRRDRLLAELYEIAFIPALTLAMPSRTTSPPRTLLAVGYDGGADAETPRLRAAEREAAAVADLYRGSAVLLGAEAVPAAVQRAARDREVLHFAAHARANRLLPWESFLRLAAPDDAPARGLLRFGDLMSWDLRACRLVVLSACETATGPRFRGEGVVSLAKPFLAAGARTVVGTLWDIDDRVALPFMMVFHRRIAAGQSPPAALRDAQLAALASDDPALRAPSLWGAYVVNTREIPVPES